MILAIDIGNTNIVLGCVDDNKTYFIERLSTIKTKMELEYAIDIKMVLDSRNQTGEAGRSDHQLGSSADYICRKRGGRKDSEKRDTGHRTWREERTQYPDG